MVKKTQNLVPILALAVFILGGLWVLNSGEPAQPLAPGSVAPAPGTAVAPGSPGSVVSTAPVNSGELELFLKKSDGGTGITSKLLLLDASEWKGSEAATRYSVMKALADKGIDGLKGYSGGTPKEISVSTGEWSESQLVGHVGDQLVAYTYENQATTAAGNNVSTAKLLTLKDFYRETGKWVATTQLGESTWNIMDYAVYDWRDGGDVAEHSSLNPNYFYDDDGSADVNVVITFYSRADAMGEKCVDCAIFMEAPANYTAKFRSLTVTDKSGHSKKFTTMSKAENFAGDDPRSVAASKLTDSSEAASFSPIANWDWYYIGQIPDDFMTTYTSGDKNRLTWELETDTYGANTSLLLNLVQNTGAKGTTNGVFTINRSFEIKFGNGASSGFGRR